MKFFKNLMLLVLSLIFQIIVNYSVPIASNYGLYHCDTDRFLGERLAFTLIKMKPICITLISFLAIWPQP
jgi:hypothetical protein